jgi:DNA-binding HxlR family transcriptional regulator
MGRRWTLRLLRELRTGELTFVALRCAADDLSQSLLTARLADLQEADLVQRSDQGGYRLTPTGEELVAQVGQLDRWATAGAERRPPD